MTETERPNRTPPLPPPPLDRHRPRRIAGTLVFLGVGVAIWWGVVSYLGMLDRISAFERLPIPGSRVIVISEPVTKMLSIEAARRTPVPAVRFAVIDPIGRAVAVRTYEGDLRYDVPGEPGGIGRAVATFEARVEGVYSIDVIGTSGEGAVVAIGDDVARPSVPAILGALFLLSISAVGGVVLLGRRFHRQEGSAMRTRERMRVPATTTIPPLPERNDTAHGAVRLTRVAIGAIALYALAALALLPEGSPSITARVVLGILIVSAAMMALVVVRSAPTRARGASSLVIGFAMTAVTGGVVAKRLADGVSAIDALGGIAGVAGVALVVLGWRLTLRRIPRRWARITIGLLSTLLVAQFVLLPAGVALDVTNRPRPTGSDRTPADVGLPFEDVRIPIPDGTSLSAWWIPSTNGAAMVLLPGSGSTRHAVLDHAALVARHGYGALLLDWRGHGRSAGRSMEFGWGAERDVTAAISFVLNQPGVTRGVGVLGLSMGGEVGLTVTAIDDRVRALVVEGVSARTWADARLEPDPHPVGYANEWLTFALVGILAPEPPPEPLIELVPRIEAPVLMISGAPSNERKLDPIYADAARDMITLWALPDTPHTQALRVHPAAYERSVISLFDEALLESDG